MWNQLADLAELSGRREEPLELLQGLFAPTHWVWVRRRDVLRQAVSLWRALQTQTWRDVGAAVDAVLAHLGLEPVGDGGGEPPMKRQSDGISDEWAEAHRRGIAVRPHNTPHPLSPRK